MLMEGGKPLYIRLSVFFFYLLYVRMGLLMRTLVAFHLSLMVLYWFSMASQAMARSSHSKTKTTKKREFYTNIYRQMSSYETNHRYKYKGLQAMNAETKIKALFRFPKDP